MDALSYKTTLNSLDAKILILKGRLQEVEALVQEIGTEVLAELEVLS